MEEGGGGWEGGVGEEEGGEEEVEGWEEEGMKVGGVVLRGVEDVRLDLITGGNIRRGVSCY